ncbi:MAG TPA: hypothetical protein LFW13_04990 [Rickettsia endosymbiont of Sericostoma sp.]|uniref:hypothetical protein n=1 Tax=unclassified Candidatus Tisiphia TaxID=2996318 RepID=UPI001D6CA5CA|nr:hypothetical protein [Rickettsia endosymbiont of Sericostoma sp. HW-2014]HJD64335.1 hypothetical protein [Rickettsia endosymbiont of Sericostoma sp.]
MSRLAFTNMVKREIPLWIFAMRYSYTLLSCSIMSIILGFKSFEYINQKLTNSSWTEQALYDYIKTGDLQELINLNFFIGIVFAMILVISCFSYSHINFLKHYSTKNFEISRSGKITDDIWFIIIYINVGGVFNAIIQYFIASDWLYRFISLYLVQTTLLYFMLKMNCCGYKLIPQLAPQVTPPSQPMTKKGLKRRKKRK